MSDTPYVEWIKQVCAATNAVTELMSIGRLFEDRTPVEQEWFLSLVKRLETDAGLLKEAVSSKELARLNDGWRGPG